MPRGRRTLLLADDSPTIQKVISLTFSDEGLEVIAVGDGGEAFRRMEESAPDIVLADAVMPGVNGYELCERIKGDARFRHIPVMLLVGTFEPFNEAEARRVGADTVLTKPFQSIRDLVNKVGSLIGGGESKHPEDEAANAVEPHRADAGERLVREADIPARPHAPQASASGETGRGGGADRAGSLSEHPASFGDIEMDDQMIEARPAEAFGVAGAEVRQDAEPSGVEPEYFGADALEADAFEEEFTHDVFKARAEMFDETRAASVSAAAARESGEASHALGRKGAEPAGFEPERSGASDWPAFKARGTDAASADEALLDLGDDDSHGGPAEEPDDDFILDLTDDSPPTFRPAHAGVSGADSPLSFEHGFAGAHARPDAAGAFAEASHGTEAPHAEAVAAPRDYTPAPPEAGWGEPTPTEVITQDEPQSQGARHEPQSQDWSDAAATSEEPRVESGMSTSQLGRAHEFIEPQVVPAEVPAPSEADEDFTDGSVEGDVAKSPAALGSFNAVDASGMPDASQAAAEAFAAETSSDLTSGTMYAHDASRRGAGSAQGPGELSPEAVDAIARRVVELMSDKVVREIAWEVVPDLAELLLKRRLDEERGRN